MKNKPNIKIGKTAATGHLRGLRVLRGDTKKTQNKPNVKIGNFAQVLLLKGFTGETAPSHAKKQTQSNPISHTMHNPLVLRGLVP